MAVSEPAKTFSAETLAELANKFLTQEMYQEALTLLKEGCDLYPDNITLKVQLGRTLDAQKQTQVNGPLSPKAILAREQCDRRANILFGLADLHIRRNENAKACALLEEAIKLSPINFLSYLTLGRIYYQDKRFAPAVDLLTRARTLNPFHEDLCYYLALSNFYLEKHEDALAAMIDALILSGDLEKLGTSPYQQKIQLIIEKFPGFDRNMRNQLIKERQHKFKTFYDKILSDIHANHISTAPSAPQAAAMPPTPLPLSPLSDDQYQLAARLKRFFILKNLDDRTIGKLASFTKELKLKEASHLYKEGGQPAGLFLLEKGEVRLIKETPLGNLDLLTIGEGRFFGDDDLLFSSAYHTSAIASSSEALILLLDHGGLVATFSDQNAIALHFYWYFWKNLAMQIRMANEQLKSFFSSPRPLRRPIQSNENRQEKNEVHFQLAVNHKETTRRESGIETDELRLIAQLCTEELYNTGEFIFHEGDPGDKLYVVMAGEVLISKHIDGVGEEALAILKHGDFFGEMALIDGESRSADAKAHKSGTTVLAIKRDSLKEVLDVDTKSACQFLTVLYRLLNQRLREIREKIYQWKIMAGGF